MVLEKIMPNKKVRRHSGRYTPRVINPGMKHSEMIENAEEPKQEYDDWIEYRDGMRDWPGIERKKRELEKERRK